MNNQTESYIVLKPIAERFSKVANEISDEEIKTMIKSVIQDRKSNATLSATWKVCSIEAIF